jgi:hypothetical protein
VAWDTAAAVTPMGSLVYFGQYLSTEAAIACFNPIRSRTGA